MTRLGIDLDNTLFDYGPALRELVLEKTQLQLPIAWGKDKIKRAIQDSYGEEYWTLIQGYLYTDFMPLAQVDPCAIRILNSFQSLGWAIEIISHKTQFPYAGARKDLREAARTRFSQLVSKEPNLQTIPLHFFDSKEAKIKYINSFMPNIFIDDLPEILLSLSPEIQKFLLNSNCDSKDLPLIYCHSWGEVERIIENYV